MSRAMGILIALVFCFLLPATVGALDVSIDRLAFLPARFGPGEEVEAFALVRVEGGEPKAFSAQAGKGLPNPSAKSDPELRSFSLSKGKGGWEIRLRFVAWSPGKGHFPTMDVRGYRIPGFEYEAASVLVAGDSEARPPKAQLDPPGTALYLYGFLGLVLALSLAVFGAAAYVLPAARRLLAQRRAGEARRALGRSLSWLGHDLGGRLPIDVSAFHAALSRAVRLYLAARVLPGASALTPSELRGLAEERFPARGLRDEVAALLDESDQVRFAAAAADEDSLLDALARAARIGDLAEEALDARL